MSTTDCDSKQNKTNNKSSQKMKYGQLGRCSVIGLEYRMPLVCMQSISMILCFPAFNSFLIFHFSFSFLYSSLFPFVSSALLSFLYIFFFSCFLSSPLLLYSFSPPLSSLLCPFPFSPLSSPLCPLLTSLIPSYAHLPLLTFYVLYSFSFFFIPFLFILFQYKG